MKRIIKKSSAFFYWVFLPSLIFVLSVFAINLIPRPAISLYGSSGCTADSDCTGNPTNSCVVEFCDIATSDNVGVCDIASYDPACQCGSCGNGRCEMALGEGQFQTTTSNQGQVTNVTCPEDCVTDNFLGGAWAGVDGVRDDPVCLDQVTGGPGTPLVHPCGHDLDKINTVGNGNVGPALDGCCPTGCQGDNPADTATFDADCAPNFNGSMCLNVCGNGIVEAGAGEQCDPPGSSCSNGTGTCDSQCQCVVPPPAVPICGNGIVETGEQCEGTTCNATQSDGSVIPGICQNCQCLPQCEAEGSGCGDTGKTQAPCFSGVGGTTAGGSLIPPPLHPTVLAQWLAAFAVPGAVFTGLRMRRKK